MQDRSFSSTLAGLVVLSALTWSRGIAAQPPADAFSTCETNFATEPQDQQSARCFFEVAKGEARWDEAARLLDGHRSRHPENPWLALYLGHVLLFSRPPQAEELYREAVTTSESISEPDAEVEARLSLTRYLAMLGRLEEGDSVLTPAVRIAENKEDPLLLAEVRIRQAWQYRYHGRELDYAYHLLHRVEPDIFPVGPEDLKIRWLNAMMAVSHVLGRSDTTLSCLERLLALAQEAGDPVSEASARFSIAIHHITTELPSPNARRKARSLFEAALATAETADHLSIQASAHYNLGRLLSGEQRRKHLEACLAIAVDLGKTGLELLSKCQGALAASLVDEDPGKASELIDRALATARNSNVLWDTAYGSAERLHMRWATLSRTEAIADSLEVLDTLETLRELQGSGSGRAGLMELLSDVYYRLSGRLLEGTEVRIAEGTGLEATKRRNDLELAFAVTERMRARVLLEALETARAVSAPPSAEPLVRQLATVLKRKVDLNRLLLRPDLQREEREQAISDLDAVESEESGLRHQIARASPSYGALRAPVAPLAEIEQSLDEDEAMFSYQVGLDEDFFSGWFAGGSWLLVSTREGTRSYRLPDRVALEPALDVFLGVSELGEATGGQVRLYRDLLGDALDDLPPGIDRLVIIPDGKLHRLPFGLLRSAEDAEPVITRYQLSVTPSATLWLRWRRLDPPTSEVAALALADPLLVAPQAAPGIGRAGGSGIGRAGGSGERLWALEQGARLDRLPYARQEGQAVVRTLGGESLLLLGAEATESFLKENDLGRYGVLHFATHAVINDEVPERSAVLLAPGAEDEDGWLQPQDIVELELEGRVVVLASCNSAAGQVLRGEGPMSLARSFFHAGAPVVVASLWPLPDDETARLFKEFYRSLATGTSVAGALATAQRKMLRRGAPARSWAGLVALGDGDLVPFPGGLPGRGLPAWVYPVLALLGIAALLLVLRRVRRAA